MQLPHYVWRDPERPLTVELSLRFLSRLVAAGRNAAAGGLLLGHSRLRDGRHILTVEDYRQTFSGEAAHAADAVGMYRVAGIGESLRMQGDDGINFKRDFMRPDAVFLVLQPSFGRAALFAGEGDDLALVHEFSFRLPAPPPRRWWTLPHIPAWVLEISALVFGIVAGVALIQRFQPPPVAQTILKPAAEPTVPASATPPTPPPSTSADRTASESLPEPIIASLPPAEPPPERRVRSVPPKTESTPERRPSPFAAASKVAARPAAPAATSGSAPVPAPAPPAAAPSETPVTVAHASTPPATGPAPPAAPSVPRQREPEITVKAEAAGSKLGKVVGRLPLLRRLGRRNDAVVPPAARREVRPTLTARERAELTQPVLVNVRVYVDPQGKVEYAELLSDGKRHPNLSSAAVYASRRWDFTPAAQGGEPVPAEVILHFRFAPPEPASPTAVARN